jgi:hypothetical protein
MVSYRYRPKPVFAVSAETETMAESGGLVLAENETVAEYSRVVSAETKTETLHQI